MARTLSVDGRLPQRYRYQFRIRRHTRWKLLRYSRTSASFQRDLPNRRRWHRTECSFDQIAESSLIFEDKCAPIHLYWLPQSCWPQVVSLEWVPSMSLHHCSSPQGTHSDQCWPSIQRRICENWLQLCLRTQRKWCLIEHNLSIVSHLRQWWDWRSTCLAWKDCAFIACHWIPHHLHNPIYCLAGSAVRLAWWSEILMMCIYLERWNYGSSVGIASTWNSVWKKPSWASR